MPPWELFRRRFCVVFGAFTGLLRLRSAGVTLIDKPQPFTWVMNSNKAARLFVGMFVMASRRVDKSIL